MIINSINQIQNPMRRFFVLLLTLFISVALNAQEHLTFKNIPIEGNMSNFITKMKAAGFKLNEMKDVGAIMTGPFVGYDCTLAILCSRSSKTVWKVVAHLPSQVSWTSTRSQYDDFKERYTKKYGAPTQSFEFFLDPYERGDGYELQAIKLEKGHYVSYWDTPGGMIAVEIAASSNTDGWIKIVYEDAIGADVQSKEKDQMIDDEI